MPPLSKPQALAALDDSLVPVVVSSRTVRPAIDAARAALARTPRDSLVDGTARARLDEALAETASASARIARILLVDLNTWRSPSTTRTSAVRRLAAALELATSACGDPDPEAVASAERAARALRTASNSPRLAARDEEGAENA